MEFVNHQTVTFTPMLPATCLSCSMYITNSWSYYTDGIFSSTPRSYVGYFEVTWHLLINLFPAKSFGKDRTAKLLNLLLLSLVSNKASRPQKIVDNCSVWVHSCCTCTQYSWAFAKNCEVSDIENEIVIFKLNKNSMCFIRNNLFFLLYRKQGEQNTLQRW